MMAMRLPAQTLTLLDAAARQTGETRSAFAVHALQRHLAAMVTEGTLAV